MSPLLVLIVAVLATTYAGPIVRFAAAPALAVAFWRLAMVLPVTGALAALEGSREQGAGSSVARPTLLPAPRSLLPLMTLSGLLLALRDQRVCRGCRGARAARARAHSAPRGVRAPRLGGVRCDGRWTHADRTHRDELRPPALPRDDGERRGAGGAGGGERDRVVGA